MLPAIGEIRCANARSSAVKAILKNSACVLIFGFATIRTTFIWGGSSVGRASRSQRGGQGFESPSLHHIEKAAKVVETTVAVFLLEKQLASGWRFYKKYSQKRRSVAKLHFNNFRIVERLPSILVSRSIAGGKSFYLLCRSGCSGGDFIFCKKWR